VEQADKTEGNTTQILEHSGQARAVTVMSGAALLAQRGASGSKRNSAQRRRPAWIELRPCTQSAVHSLHSHTFTGAMPGPCWPRARASSDLQWHAASCPCMGQRQHDGDHEGDSDAAVQVQVSSPYHLPHTYQTTLVLWHGKDGSNAVQQVAQQGSAARRRAPGLAALGISCVDSLPRSAPN
jgi:hypothetical protein